MGQSKPVVVRSAANPKVRHLIRMRDNRARRKAGRVIVDGWRETDRAWGAGLTLFQICIAESSAPPRLALQIDPSQQKTIVVSDALMEKVCYGSSPRGVVAEFERPKRSLDQLQLPPDPLILLLDRVEKPGNVGAIFRCADGLGIDAVLLCESADPFNPNSIRNSLGSVFHVPTAIGTTQEFEQFLIDNRIDAIAARLESSEPLWSINLQGGLAIILGSEADGLGDRWSHLGSSSAGTGQIPGLRIPMQGKGDSLNVSVSAALICYEAIRQRDRRNLAN